MDGYILSLDQNGASGVVQQHGTNRTTYSFYNYGGVPLKVQATVSFDPCAACAPSMTRGSRK